MEENTKQKKKKWLKKKDMNHLRGCLKELSRIKNEKRKLNTPGESEGIV